MGDKSVLINLTPHVLDVYRDEGKHITIPPSGQVARVTVHHVPVLDESYEGTDIPINRLEYDDVEGLPSPEPGIWYVVSEIAGQAAAALGRRDILIPDERMKLNDGRVVGCKSFRLIG
jgi:hypothetical protein